MATTTNYGWTTPDDTALVKDGASAIRALGTAIDTSMNTALGTKKAGMVLLNTTSFSAVSSFSLAANTFSSTYTNYRMTINGTQSATGYVATRFRAAGVDDSSSNYYYSMVQTRTGATQTLSGGGAFSLATIWRGSSTGGWRVVLDILCPQLNTDNSSWLSLNTATDGTGTHIATAFGTFLGTTSFDSLSFFTETGTMSGTYSVYGYNK